MATEGEDTAVSATEAPVVGVDSSTATNEFGYTGSVDGLKDDWLDLNSTRSEQKSERHKHKPALEEPPSGYSRRTASLPDLDNHSQRSNSKSSFRSTRRRRSMVEGTMGLDGKIGKKSSAHEHGWKIFRRCSLDNSVVSTLSTERGPPREDNHKGSRVFRRKSLDNSIPVPAHLHSAERATHNGAECEDLEQIASPIGFKVKLFSKKKHIRGGATELPSESTEYRINRSKSMGYIRSSSNEFSSSADGNRFGSGSDGNRFGYNDKAADSSSKTGRERKSNLLKPTASRLGFSRTWHGGANSETGEAGQSTAFEETLPSKILPKKARRKASMGSVDSHVSDGSPASVDDGMPRSNIPSFKGRISGGKSNDMTVIEPTSGTKKFILKHNHTFSKVLASPEKKDLPEMIVSPHGYTSPDEHGQKIVLRPTATKIVKSSSVKQGGPVNLDSFFEKEKTKESSKHEKQRRRNSANSSSRIQRSNSMSNDENSITRFLSHQRHKSEASADDTINALEAMLFDMSISSDKNLDTDDDAGNRGHSRSSSPDSVIMDENSLHGSNRKKGGNADDEKNGDPKPKKKGIFASLPSFARHYNMLSTLKFDLPRRGKIEPPPKKTSLKTKTANAIRSKREADKGPPPEIRISSKYKLKKKSISYDDVCPPKQPETPQKPKRSLKSNWKKSLGLLIVVRMASVFILQKALLTQGFWYSVEQGYCGGELPKVEAPPEKPKPFWHRFKKAAPPPPVKVEIPKSKSQKMYEFVSKLPTCGMYWSSKTIGFDSKWLATHGPMFFTALAVSTPVDAAIAMAGRTLMFDGPPELEVVPSVYMTVSWMMMVLVSFLGPRSTAFIASES